MGQKYLELETFLNDLEKNKGAILAKIAQAEMAVSDYRTAFNKSKGLHDVCNTRVQDLADQRAENPLSITLSKEHRDWEDRKNSHIANMQLNEAGLKAAEKYRDELYKKHSDLDPSQLADSATVEMRNEIESLYSVLQNMVTTGLEKKQEYLAAIAKIIEIRNKGRHAVEAGQKAARLSKKENLGYKVNAPEHFDFDPKLFVITLKNITGK